MAGSPAEMRVRGVRHRAPLRMTAGVRLAQAACPLGRSQRVDAPGEDRRADAIERCAVVGVQRVDLRTQDGKPSGRDPLASAHPESVSVTCTVRRSAVPRARVTCPSASSWSTSRTARERLSPRLQAAGRSGSGTRRRPARRPRPPDRRVPRRTPSVAASTSRASRSTTAPSTFAVWRAPESMPGAYIRTRVACIRHATPRRPHPRHRRRRGGRGRGRRGARVVAVRPDPPSRRPIWRRSGWSSISSTNACVVRDGERVVGYGALQELGDLWRAEAYVYTPTRPGAGSAR